MRTLILFWTLLTVGLAYGEENTMTKIVTKDISPGVDEGSFDSYPKTLYFCGEKKGRLEEYPDSALGLHMLVVYNNGDIWMANLFDKTGQHIVDPGPKIAFSAPVFATAAQGNTNDTLDNFIYGKEIEFLTANGAQIEVSDDHLQLFRLATDKYRIKFYFNVRDNLPDRAEIYENDKLMGAIKYLEYVTNVKCDDKLFEKPKGITFIDAE